MRIVLDTNVLVSALINPHGAPGRVLGMIVSEEVVLLYDDRILAEYREVLARPRLRISRNEAEFILGFIESEGVHAHGRPLFVEIGDPDDLPFLEVAAANHADALVTGNKRDFLSPGRPDPVLILSPAEFLEFWNSRNR